MNQNIQNHNSLRQEIKNAIAPNIYWCDNETVDADYEKIIDAIIKLFEKHIRDLEMEYSRRRIFELDKKVVFEDIQDILDGKTYSEIFHDDWWEGQRQKNDNQS